VYILLLAIGIAMLSAAYSTHLWISRAMWSAAPDPDAPLNIQRLQVRGWPAAFLVRTPVGWRFTTAEFVMDAVLSLPIAALVVLWASRRKRSHDILPP